MKLFLIIYQKGQRKFQYHNETIFPLYHIILAYRPALRTFQLALRGYSGFALRARISLASLVRVLRLALTKIFEKKSVSQPTQNVLKRVKMQKKKLPLLTQREVHENFRKKSVSQSTRNALKRIEMQKKKFYPYDRLRAKQRSAKPERRSATLPTPCHPQGPKECPYQVSCRLD